MHTKYKHCVHLPTIDVTFSFCRCFPPAVSPRCGLPIGSPELTPPPEVHLLSSPHFEVDLLSSSVMSVCCAPPFPRHRCLDQCRWRLPRPWHPLSITLEPSPARALALGGPPVVSPPCVSHWHHHLR